jgi:hypothetical protein
MVAKVLLECCGSTQLSISNGWGHLNAAAFLIAGAGSKVKAVSSHRSPNMESAAARRSFPFQMAEDI